ncbi:MAG: US12 family protein [Acidobacteria bacterium]|nr:US12 family protein [Acidobacteriota bacterium]
MDDFTTTFGTPAAEAAPADRAAFIRRTYTLLAVAILAFIGVEVFFFATPIAEAIFSVVVLGGRLGWLAIIVGFMVISWLSNKWAASDASVATQYFGLSVFIIGEAVIFVPLLYLAAYASGDPAVILKAGIVSLGLFAGLTLTVFVTRSDFSWLAPILGIGFFAAVGLIVTSLLLGFSLGNIFAFFMVALAGSSILYQTSQVMLRFNTRQHVAAALTLFASVALLFWWILRIFVGSRR